MKPLKIVCLIMAVCLVFVLFAGYFPVKAQEDNVNVHVKVEVSSDGAMWYNYSGTESPGGSTLMAQPGDTIYIRVSIWNNGTAPTPAATGTGSITNSSYLGFTNVENDSDHGGTSFTGSFFSGAGTGTTPFLGANTLESNAQSLTATAKLSADFPVGTTYITGQVTIIDYALIARLPSNLAFVDTALAAGRNRVSSFRVAVTVEAPAADNDDSGDTQTTTETAEELPSTGCDYPGLSF